MSSIPLNELAFKYSLENTYKSNLNELEKILVDCFLLVLKKNGFYSLRDKSLGNDHKRTIPLFIEEIDNREVIELFDGYIGYIIQKVRKPYLNALVGHFHSLEINIDGVSLQEYFDSLLISFFDGQSKFGGDSLQPKELTRVLNYFIPKKKNLSYYNPFAGLASLALDLPKNINYYGEELNQQVWLLAKLRMLMHNCPSFFLLENKNSIESWHYSGSALYDYISYNPPFNLRLDESFPRFLNEEEFGNHRNANSLIVSQTFKKLNDGGIMSFVMPNGFLASNSPKDKAFRKYLVDNKLLKSVISLPPKTLRFTSIPFNVIVLSKSSLEDKIHFIDASELYSQDSSKLNRIDLKRLFVEIDRKDNSEHAKFIKSEIVAENDYNLSINRYVFEEPILAVSEEEKLIKLSSLINPLPKEKPNLREARSINIGELSDDSLQPNLDIKNLPLNEVKTSFSALKQNALLIAMLGNKIKPTLFQPTKEETAYARGNILAFKIDTDKILPEYLVLELHKEYVQTQLKRIRGGSGIPRIKKDDLLNEVEIIVPSSIEQERKISQAYYEIHHKQLAKVKKLATDFNIDVADENSFLRHQIAGSMKNLRSAFKFVKKILDNEVESQIPDLYTLKANEKLPSTLGDYINIIERDLGSVTKILNKAGTEIDLTEMEIEKIDLIKFVENYKREIESRNGNQFSVEIKKDEAALLENSVKTVFIHGDKEKLRQVFDNIIGNAVKHGFENRIDPSNKIVLEFLYDFKRAEVQLDISNSGIPLPEDYSHDAFIRKGSSSGKNAGDGTGGWFINEVMKLHKGHFGFTDETGPEGIEGDAVTSIELTFPIILKQ